MTSWCLGQFVAELGVGRRSFGPQSRKSFSMRWESYELIRDKADVPARPPTRPSPLGPAGYTERGVHSTNIFEPLGQCGTLFRNGGPSVTSTDRSLVGTDNTGE